MDIWLDLVWGLFLVEVVYYVVKCVCVWVDGIINGKFFVVERIIGRYNLFYFLIFKYYFFCMYEINFEFLFVILVLIFF